MNRSIKSTFLAAAAATLLGLAMQAQAQQGPGAGGPGGPGGGPGGRNFDPAQMRQRMMDRYREALEIKSDDEWKVFEPRIQKVLDARRDVGMGGMNRFMFGRGRGGDQAGGDQAAAGRRGGFGQPSQAAQDLQKAIEGGASNDTIKAKLTAYREDRQQKQANLEKAQDELKKLLSVKQEAAAVLAGLLD